MDDNGTITEDDEVQVVDAVEECPETRVSHPLDDNAWTLFYTGHTLLDSNAFDVLFPELCCSSLNYVCSWAKASNKSEPF